MNRRRSVAILPSLFTTANLFCGFFCIVRTLSGDFTVAAGLIVLAGIFDLIDGSIARLAHAETKFGLAYDSLVDLVSFGVAPALLFYVWTLESLGRVGALASFFFIACGALRLARYNVQHDTIESRFFEGLPIPGGAGVLITFVIFGEKFLQERILENHALLAFPLVAGLLMVSSLHYRSAKTLNFKGGRNAFLILVSFVFFLFVLAAKPEVMMFALMMAYVSSGVIEELITRQKSKAFVAKVRQRREELKQEKLRVVG